MTPGDLLFALSPEITLGLGAIFVLMLGVSRNRAVHSVVGTVSFLVILASLMMAWIAWPDGEAISAYGVQVTWLSCYTRIVALSVGLLIVLVHVHLPEEDERSDLFSMILFSLTGILLTSVADNLVLLFLAIELVSVPTYILVSTSRGDIRAQEGGVKYFFLGALAAALLVYGLSFLYGASGTTTLSQATFQSDNAWLTLGLLLAFAGLAFKIAAVPFHVYVADVYQGAASPVTALLGFFPKLAGFVALIKLALAVQPAGVMTDGWVLPEAAFTFIWIVAAATMTLGNVLALMQDNVKRMLAYSSVAHSGYMLVAFAVGPGAQMRDGLSAMLFYIVVYGVMNLGAFAVLSMMQVRGREAEQVENLSGLSRKQPWLALGWAICVFSLMGMPPTAGFLGKIYLFGSALSAGESHPYATALVVLAVVGVLNSAIAAAYYLRLVAIAYLGAPCEEVRILPQSRCLRVSLAACCFTVLLVGFWPQGIRQLAPPSAADLRPSTEPNYPVEPDGTGNVSIAEPPTHARSTSPEDAGDAGT